MRASTRLDYEQRVRAVIRLLIETLDEPAPKAELAGRAHFSRYHFHRVFRRLLGETPGGLRRRLLLERAAYHLRETWVPVTELALDAGYDSLEAFTRAFRRAFGDSPSAFRLLERSRFLLPSSNGIHFRPGRSAAGPTLVGDPNVDLLDRLIDHDAWMTRQLLSRTRGADEAALDRAIAPAGRSVRELLHRAVSQKENWVAAVEGTEPPREPDRSVEGMLARMDRAFPRFAELARQVRDQGDWDRSFTDAVCEPPETFTFGGMLAHVVTHAAHRRAVIVEALQQLGLEEPSGSDPIDWERRMSPAAART
jgi:AraC-like DNA-binding protein/uncharacterized damage-inducible protein DinB